MNKWLIGLGILAILIAWWYYRHQKALEALPPRSVLIEAALNDRINTYKSNLLKKCRKEALDEAKEIADSIAFAKADALMLFDTLRRPAKPEKPGKPERLPLKDSLEVKPLLDSLGGGDSLRR